MEGKGKPKVSKHDVVRTIHRLLNSHVDKFYKLSDFFNDFRVQTGYPLPSFGKETCLDFLKSIPWIIELYEMNKKPYVRHVDWVDADDLEFILQFNLDEDSDYEKELEREELEEKKKTQIKEKEENENKEKAEKEGKKAKENEKVPSRSTSPDQSKSPGDEAQNLDINKKKKRKRKARSSGRELSCSLDSEEEGDFGDESICHKCEFLKNELKFEFCIDKCLSNILTDIRDIPLINLKERTDEGDLIEVSVTEVVHPHKFYVNLRRFRVELIKLMGRMRSFYALYTSKYSLGNFKFVKNMMCAALYKTSPECREWYRAKIINCDENTSKVLLIDYGLITEISNQNLRYLDRIFAELPVQAITARLGRIMPKSEKHWTEDTCKRLYDITFDRDLIAKVLFTNTEKRWLSVSLSLPNSGFSIDDALVKDKYPNPDCDFHPDSNPRTYYESLDQELFVLPEDVKKNRRLRSEFGDLPREKKKTKIPYQERNRELRKMCGLEVSDEERSSNTE